MLYFWEVALSDALGGLEIVQRYWGHLNEKERKAVKQRLSWLWGGPDDEAGAAAQVGQRRRER